MSIKAFDIEPKIKPDMSKYLIHMTGKDALCSILKGGRRKGEGLIKSQVPNGSKGDNFNSKISCFTETPTFALGGFITISKRRASENMIFGIGFRKTYMVENNVRPTIYLDNSLLSKIFSLKNNDINSDVNNVIHTIKSLAHPLGEASNRQGFTWEREWRFIDDKGFFFDHKAIEVIFCPEEEQHDLKYLLGSHSKRIRFIDSCEQYKEYTNHIQHFDAKERIIDESKAFDYSEIKEFLENYDNHLEELQEYKDYLQTLENSIEDIEKYIYEISEWKKYIDKHTAEFCGHFSKNIVIKQGFGTICKDCSEDYDRGLSNFVSKN